MMRSYHPSLRNAVFAVLAAALLVLPLACGGGGGSDSGGGGPVTVPDVTSTIPTDGADNFGNTGDVVINFSEAMDTVSVQGGFSIVTYAGTPAFAWAPGNAQATVSFSPDLAAGSHYVVSLASSVMDAQGTSLAAAYSFSFDTASVPIASINSPADGQTNVALSPTINITFSEDMDNGSVENNFAVSGYPSSSGFTFTWNSPTDLDITFDVPLDGGVTYTATLLPMAESATGVQLGVASQVTFSTGGSLATGAISGTIDDDPDSSYDNSLEKTMMALFDHDFTGTVDGNLPVLSTADASGAYHFSYLEDGDYWILALQDTNGDGQVGGDKFAEDGDSAGLYTDISAFAITSVNISGGAATTGIDFTMLDSEAIAGEVTYSGSNTTAVYDTSTAVYVGAFTSQDYAAGPDYGAVSWTNDSDDFDTTTNIWNYAINSFFETGTRMNTGDYYVGAFIDLNSNGTYDSDLNGNDTHDDGEPAGIFASTVPIHQIGQDAVGVDIVTYDTILINGMVESLTDTTTMNGVPYQGATVTLMGYPLSATTDTTGAFSMGFVPLGINTFAHAEPASGSSLIPWNTQYYDIDTTMAASSGGGGAEMTLLSSDVLSFIASACSVTIQSGKAQVAGNYNIDGGEVLFADGTVKYIDSQMDCSYTSNQLVTDGPSFFVFNVDDTLFSGNKGDIEGTVGGSVVVTETIPVRADEITWVDLLN